LPSETIAVIATARNDRAYEASAALFIFIFPYFVGVIIGHAGRATAIIVLPK
jgi:hypothetical protein